MARRQPASIWGVIFGALLAALGSGLATTEAHSRPISTTPTTITTSSTLPRTESADAGDTAASCGIERWDVKTGTDPGAAKINLTTAVPISIAQLDALAPPVNPTARITPVEVTVYEVGATLTGYKTEADSDYHLVLSDGTHTMIAEIPFPDCVSSGPLASGIAKARAQFDGRLTGSKVFKHVSVPVTIRGVGFFDRIHGQTGVAPNGIELHPVLDITFS